MIAALLVLTLAVFWYVGRKTRVERQEKQEGYFRSLVEKEKNLRANVEENLAKKGTLASYNPTDIFSDTNANIKPLPAANAVAIRDYYEKMAAILKPLGIKRENEVRILLSALDTGNRELLKNIMAARTTYADLAVKLASVPPPTDILALQSALVSTLNRITKLVGNMELAFEEPILALGSGRQFLSEISQTADLVAKINDYLLTNKIITENEAIVIYISEE